MDEPILFQGTALSKIPGISGYLAGNNGEIYSLKSAAPRWWAETTAPKLKKKRLSSNGYYDVFIGKPLNRREAIHRLVCAAFHGAKPFACAVVRHLDGVHTNNAPSNLTWGTDAENKWDAVVHGSIQVGENSPLAKLSSADVLVIRAAVARGVDSGFLRARFAVSASLVRKIGTGASRLFDYGAADPGALSALLADYERFPKRNSGSKNRSAKLTEAQVVQIRIRHHAGASIRFLAGEFGVDASTIRPIIMGRTWKHLLHLTTPPGA